MKIEKKRDKVVGSKWVSYVQLDGLDLAIDGKLKVGSMYHTQWGLRRVVKVSNEPIIDLIPDCPPCC